MTLHMENAPGQGGAADFTTQQSTAQDGLFDNHRRELVQDSVIDPAVIAERGYRSIGRPTRNDQRPREELKRLGIPTWATSEDWYFPGLLIPMYRATGELVSHQFKPNSPVPNRDGKKMKYASTKGKSAVLDVHPRWFRDRGTDDPALVPYIRDVQTQLWITEGIKKADSLTSQGLCTVGLQGVYNWRSTMGSLGDWEDIPLRGREVVICFDADAITNMNVLRAMKRLGAWLKSKGAKPGYLIVPAMVNGSGVKGVDDYFAAGGSVEGLREHIRNTPPDTDTADDTFTDAKMAETIADDVLAEQFCWTAGMGWMRWDGVRWQACGDEAPIEAVRQYVLERLGQVVQKMRTDTGQAGNTNALDGWRSMTSANRMKAVLGLTKGIVIRDAAEFDTHHDLLNTPGGVVDLRTGEVMPHDPNLLMTKVTKVSYKADAEHPLWSKALAAVPEDSVDWLKVRLGQATTGYMPDDDRMVLLSGGGKNGKTTLMNAVFSALGGYAAAVPNTLLLTGRSAGAATPEKMTIMGVRLAYIEETPEDRILDVNALKEVVGTPNITGRFLHKNLVTFGSTHAIFLNTNYPPRVVETDEGTWRRLYRIDFPYRFRKPGEPLERPEDRHGDSRLRDGLAANAEALEAVLAWLVAGAMAWYAAGTLDEFKVPDTVEQDTRKWRYDADLILRYLDEHVEFDPDSFVVSKDLYEHFCTWLTGQGHRAMPMNTLLSRLKAHTALPAYVTAKQVSLASATGRSRPTANPWISQQRSEPARTVAVLGLRYRLS